MDTSISRKDFLTKATFIGVCGMLTGILQTQKQPAAFDPNLLLNVDEGEIYLIGERKGRVTIKIGKQKNGIQTMSLLTEDIGPGDEIPVHKHSSEEEFIFIENGTGIFTFGDEEYKVTAGSMALVPRTVWHGLRNESEENLRMVFGYTPAGFENYFRAIGVKPGAPSQKLSSEDWKRINSKYGVVYRD
ncbi:cupin domain-containing protein [Fodinibius halophilus]|uniref:Cupin domain-containing protein n=1 Tax=Fodinibius halophilus TaxID=1736908 RepID=A0A6M1TFE2_9BACT|nr:cupin domain-containing protein [Fodinibius halophilus]NGP89514.1 cupin domain-containing protein [Fodinibius halophilus]